MVNFVDFSDFSDSIDYVKSEDFREKLNPESKRLKKLVKEFQDDLTKENVNNLEFIKFVISSITENNIELPILPHIANKMMELIADENSTFSDYANLVINDPSITLKILKLANSPVYRASREVTDIKLAISRVGIDGVKEITITESLHDIILRNKNHAELIGDIWENSILTASIAVRVSKLFNIDLSSIYTIALVHKIGSVIIFDLVDKFNAITDIENYIPEKNLLRIGAAFNKRLTVNILENWSFTDKQIISLKNYDINPIIVSKIEHKILYLSQITANALDVIKKDYDDDNIFPYAFMVQESLLDVTPERFKMIVDDSLNYYDEFLKFLYT